MSLSLDDSYVKAYFRRATARAKRDKMEDAKLGEVIILLVAIFIVSNWHEDITIYRP